MDQKQYSVIQMPQFVRRWQRLGLNDDDMLALEGLLSEGPERAPVVAGTGGVRKARFAPPSWRKGKSGASRVLYIFLRLDDTIVLCNIYAKGEQDDLSEEQRREVKAVADWLKARRK